ncbi:MAG TPA: META domain-containing protein [Candidatus Limnocylindrales bacterium]|nr:META domain-containing protein [Candidatus Limnocylindrales bacterium]
MSTIWRRIGATLAVMALLPALAACSAAGGAPSAPGAEDLSGTSWTLVDLGGTAPAEGTSATLAFDAADAVSGKTGCNSFNGQAAIDGSAIDFGPLATTRMACPEPQMSLETAYLGALDAATSWKIEDGKLILEGGTTATFDPA